MKFLTIHLLDNLKFLLHSPLGSRKFLKVAVSFLVKIVIIGDLKEHWKISSGM